MSLHVTLARYGCPLPYLRPNFNNIAYVNGIVQSFSPNEHPSPTNEHHSSQMTNQHPQISTHHHEQVPNAHKQAVLITPPPIPTGFLLDFNKISKKAFSHIFSFPFLLDSHETPSGLQLNLYKVNAMDSYWIPNHFV